MIFTAWNGRCCHRYASLRAALYPFCLFSLQGRYYNTIPPSLSLALCTINRASIGELPHDENEHETHSLVVTLPMDIPFAVTLPQPLFFTAILDARAGRLRLATCGARQTIVCHQFHFGCIASDSPHSFNHLTCHNTHTLWMSQQSHILLLNL